MTVTAFADQLNAASRDARHVLDRVGELVADDGRFSRSDAAPGPYARELLAGVRRATRNGRLRRCRHLSGRGPAPAWLLGWKPGRLFCHRCSTVELLVVRSSEEDFRCDVCRDVTPRMHVALAAAGPLLVTYGCCPDCFQVETGRVAP